MRLKSYNAGARLHLAESDLLIAQVLPVSLSVHIVKLIVGRDGGVEFGEYVLRGKQQQFVHRQFGLSEDEISRIEGELAELGQLESFLKRRDIVVDVAEFEESSRRLLRYSRDGEELHSSLPSPSFFRESGIDGHITARFTERFEATWRLVSDILARSRALENS